MHLRPLLVFSIVCICVCTNVTAWSDISADDESSYNTDSLASLRKRRGAHLSRRDVPAGNLYLTAKFAPPKCERIRAEHCANIGYNTTRFPNLAGDATAAAAAESFATFVPLLGVKCARELPFFLCSVYFPMCTDKVAVAIGPCRPLCETVRDGCITVLKEFGFPWPASLNCSKFPAENSQDQMCMGGGPPDSTDQSEDSRSSDETPSPQSNSNDKSAKIASAPIGRGDENYAQHLRKYILPGQTCLLSSMIYVNRSAQCVPLCSSTRGFTSWDLAIARTATLLTSGICAVLGAICTVATLVLRQIRRRNSGTPSRPLRAGILPSDAAEIFAYCSRCGKRQFESALLYSTICFVACALLQILSVYEAGKLACTSYNLRQVFVVMDATAEHVPCTIVGTLLYFFGSAARLWWLLACRRVSRCCVSGEVPSKFGQIHHTSVIQQRDRNRVSVLNSHLIAWCASLALCTMALMARTVQPEPLASICRVGGTSASLHRIFVLLRDFIFAICAVVFMTWNTFKQAVNVGSGVSKGGSFSKRCYVVLCTRVFSFRGFIGSLLPLTTAVLLVVQLHEHYSVVAASTAASEGSSTLSPPPNFASVYVNWNVGVAYKLLADNFFGIIFGLATFAYLARAFCRRQAIDADCCGGGRYGYRAVSAVTPPSHAYDVYEYGRTTASFAYQPLQLEMPSGGGGFPPRPFQYADGTLRAAGNADGAVGSAGNASLSSGGGGALPPPPPPPPPPPSAQTYISAPPGVQNQPNNFSTR